MTTVAHDLEYTINQFIDLPSWLAQSVDPKAVAALIRTRVPEFQSGECALDVGPFSRLHLKNNAGRWSGPFTFEVACSDHTFQTVLIDASLFAPAAALPDDIDAPATGEFGNPGWRCWFPEQRLLLTYKEFDSDLPPAPQLADPVQAQPLLERTLREQADGYATAQIESCAVKVLDHKPGSTTIFRYQIGYAPDQDSSAWQNVIFAKYYSGAKNKSHNAYTGMRNLWQSPLSRGDIVTVPQALGHIVELGTVLQGPVPEECNLEDVLRDAVRSNDPAAWDTLTDYARKTGAGLAALHQSGVQHAEESTWDELRDDVGKQIKRLNIAFPELMDGVKGILARIEALTTTTSADTKVPSHGGFRPEQVLLNQGQVGFIDFDLLCMAEPSHDLSRFRVMLKAYGSHPRRHGFPDRATMLERIDQLDAVNEVFLAAYESGAPVSRQRLAMWEALYYLNDLLHTWTKARTEDRSARVAMLETHLRGLGVS